MRKLLFALLIFSHFSCGSQQNEKKSMKNLNQILDDYYEERLIYFPLEATAIADSRYNDKLYADFTDSYREKLKTFFKK
jgi:hypothetical protein